nr:MAG TPA: hypothetical protein [Caudoviricetes sp.]
MSLYHIGVISCPKAQRCIAYSDKETIPIFTCIR